MLFVFDHGVSRFFYFFFLAHAFSFLPSDTQCLPLFCFTQTHKKHQGDLFVTSQKRARMNLLAKGRLLAVLCVLFVSAAASAVSAFASAEERATASTSSDQQAVPPLQNHRARSLLAPGDNIMVPLDIDGPNIIEGAREVLSPRARREQQQQAAAAAAAAAAASSASQQNQQKPAVAAPPQIPFVGGAVVSPPSSFKSNTNKNIIAQARDNLEAAAERLTDKAKETAANAADAAAQLGEDIRSKLPEGPPAESPSNGAAEPRGFIWLPGPEDAGDTSDPSHPGWITAPRPDARPAIGVWAGLGIAAGALLLAVVGVAVAFALAVKLRRAKEGGGSGEEVSPTAAAATAGLVGSMLHRSSTQGTATAGNTPAETPRAGA